MRLPNGFGSVHKLSGNRRKPYRVRVTVGWKIVNERERKQEYKTIGYYRTKEEGLIALSNFNESPYNLNNSNITFKELYEAWSKEHFENIVPSSKRIWKAAFNHSKPLHLMKFKNIRVIDMEHAIKNAVVGSSIKIRMKSLYNMMYKYAIKHEIVEKNYAIYCDVPTIERRYVRLPFTDEEIKILWKNIDKPFVDMILINIYSGLRPRELVEIRNCNIDLEDKFMVGGLKTEAGKNRIIPIHESIYDLIKKRYCENREFLCFKENFYPMTYDDYRNRFRKIMKQLGMNHKPHDTRHTFITLAKRCRMDEYIIKLIVGHKIEDITESTYTHRKRNELCDEINKICVL